MNDILSYKSTYGTNGLFSFFYAKFILHHSVPENQRIDMNNQTFGLGLSHFSDLVSIHSKHILLILPNRYLVCGTFLKA